MKSVHYIATIVNAYRRLIDDYYNYKYFKDFKEYQESLKRGENRPVSIGFFAGDVTTNEIIYNQKNVTASHDFVGIITSYDKETRMATMEVRNPFKGNRTLEVLSPKKAPFNVEIKEIYNDKDEVIEFSNQPKTLVHFVSDIELHQFDFIR